MICHLPLEILSSILCYLSMCDILRLQQVCSLLHELIREDKVLWSRLYEREIVLNFLPDIQYLLPLGAVSSKFLISRIEYTRRLFRIYQNGSSQGLIVSFQLRGSITWLKLIRGRWLLVASSDLTQSRISLWDVSCAPDILAAQLYLTGPVMDGKCDDSGDQITVALSIGTREPYIAIFRLSTENGRVHISQVAEIKNAFHVLLLQGSLLGYAVWHGDDTIPCLENWETRERFRFVFPSHIADNLQAIRTHNAGVDHSPGRGMIIWDGYLVVVFNFTIGLFKLPDIQDLDLELFASFKISLSQGYGNFGDAVHTVVGGVSIHNILSIFVHVRGGELRIVKIKKVADNGGSTFSVITPFDLLLGNVEGVREPRHVGPACRVTLGTSGRALAMIRLTGQSLSKEGACETCQSVELCNAQLPLLHYSSCMDFDDGLGILVLGSTEGVCTVLKFLDKCPISLQSGLRQDLPSSSETTIVTSSHIRNVILPMDLPHYYSCAPKVPDGDVSQKLLEELIEFWNEGAPMLKDYLPTPGWSNDWSRFRYLDRWVVPSPRWGHSDPVADLPRVEVTTSALVRYDLDLLGDIKPIIYNEDRHEIVIFRVGERVFVHLLDDEEGEDRISALSTPLPEFLRGDINDVVSDALERNDLSKSRGNMSDLRFGHLRWYIERIDRERAIFEREGKDISRTAMRSWDDKTWLTMVDMSRYMDTTRVFDID